MGGVTHLAHRADSERLPLPLPPSPQPRPQCEHVTIGTCELRPLSQL
jgi:hypothetical protein